MIKVILALIIGMGCFLVDCTPQSVVKDDVKVEVKKEDPAVKEDTAPPESAEIAPTKDVPEKAKEEAPPCEAKE